MRAILGAFKTIFESIRQIFAFNLPEKDFPKVEIAVPDAKLESNSPSNEAQLTFGRRQFTLEL